MAGIWDDKRSAVVTGRRTTSRSATTRWGWQPWLVLAISLCLGTPAHASLRDWWLPPNYSGHGWAVDHLFYWIFGVTMVVFVGVEAVLIVFLVKYRHRDDGRRAVFTHGNTKLEMAWTIAPAVVLLGLSLFTKRVWDLFRFGPAIEGVKPAKVLVIGEQFKWNTIYPGADGELGTYLRYPKPTDPKYFYLPYDEALKEIEKDVRANPMGQVMNAKNPADPGLDDDYAPTSAGRAMVFPVDTPLEIHLAAKDVLHDFFLPNFRVKLDAVPGMMGRIYFTATKQSTQRVSIDSILPDQQIWLSSDVPNVTLSGLPPTLKIFDADDPQTNLQVKQIWIDNLDTLQRAAGNRILRREFADAAKAGRQPLNREQISPQAMQAEIAALKQDLKSLGIAELSVVAHPFELVCEELCGAGHGTMNNLVIILSKQEYDDFLHKGERASKTPAKRAIPATQATAAANAR